MINIDIRQKIFESEIKQKDIAKTLRISPQHLCRLLRQELSDKNRARILDAIRQIEQSKTA